MIGGRLRRSLPTRRPGAEPRSLQPLGLGPGPAQGVLAPIRTIAVPGVFFRGVMPALARHMHLCSVDPAECAKVQQKCSSNSLPESNKSMHYREP
jgi:hypothetical protein